jgi:hypothetical protein
MNDGPNDVLTELASSKQIRVEIGRDGVLHVLAGYVTLHLDRSVCEELTTTLARAMVTLARAQPKARRAQLSLVGRESSAGRATNSPAPESLTATQENSIEPAR